MSLELGLRTGDQGVPALAVDAGVQAYVASCRQQGVLPILRRSLVEAFLSCAAYRPGQGPNAAFGQLMHEAIASYWLACFDANADSLPFAGEFAKHAWDRVPRGLALPTRQRAADLMETFAASHLADPDRLLRVEHTGAWQTSGLLLTGTYDRLDRTDDGDRDDAPTAVRLIDYKTEQDGPDHDFQMQWYGALVCLDMPTVQEVATEVDLIDARKAPLVRQYRREQLLAWWDEHVELLVLRLATATARPTGGAACRWCALRLTCAESMPPWDTVPENDEQARELAGEWIRADARETELRAVLRAYTDGRPDPLLVDGYEIGHLQPRRPSWKPQLPPRQVTETMPQYLKRLNKALHDAGMDTMPLEVVLGTTPTAAGKRAMLAAGLATEVYSPSEFKRRLDRD
jgi:hypothetical protein